MKILSDIILYENLYEKKYMRFITYMKLIT